MPICEVCFFLNLPQNIMIKYKIDNIKASRKSNKRFKMKKIFILKQMIEISTYMFSISYFNVHSNYSNIILRIYY